MELIRRAQQIKARVKKETALIAIGDIHGQMDLLKAALKAAHKTLPKKAAAIDLVLLGDMIDRGPHSKEVLDFAREGYRDWKTHALMGNHEQLLLKTLLSKKDSYSDDFSLWFNNGGHDTLESLGVHLPPLSKISIQDHRAEIEAGIGKKRLQFLKNLKSHYRSGDVLCVHAGINPKETLEKNFKKDPLSRADHHWAWIRDGFLDYDKPFPEKTYVVHGHTIIPGPKVQTHRIGLDTGAYRYGVLTGATFFQDKMIIFQVTKN